jgi:hypothetical protein
VTPATITTTRAKNPKTTTRPADSANHERPRCASAMGTDDDYCHILVGGSSFSYTLCGERLKPPLRRVESHAAKPAPWCPNGHPSCPACKAAR